MHRGTIVLLAILVSVGCASRQQPSLASRLVQQGTPTIDLGGPKFAHLSAKPAKRDSRPQVGVSSSISRVISGAALESTDPGLRDALLHLMAAPTVEHHLSVAREYHRLGILDYSHRYLERSLEANGPHPGVYDALARLWRDWGVPGSGLTHAHRAVYMAPGSAAAHNTLGTVLYKLGHVAEAEAEFNRALEIDPSAWYALANLCYVNNTQGNTREAIVLCRQATAMKKKQQP